MDGDEATARITGIAQRLSVEKVEVRQRFTCTETKSVTVGRSGER